MAIDPGIAAIVTAGALTSKDTINKLLGPTADYLGELLQGEVQKRAENIGRIFQKAAKKLGSKIDKPGQVHPKLLKGLILDGSFCEDELTAEYYGGILASSRTGVSRDDRGATYLEQISRLSTYQVRTHFIIYTVIKKLFQGTTHVNPGEDRIAMQIYIPHSDYYRAMAFDDNDEKGDLIGLCMDHSFTGLNASDLALFLYNGSSDYLSQNFPGLIFPKSGFIVQPTPAGLYFYLWATGHGHILLEYLLTADITIEVPEDIKMPTNAFSLKEEHKRQHNKSQQAKP